MAEPSDFGRLLDRYIHERLATAARFCELVDETGSQITRIIAGERPVPKDRLARWAKALQLKGDEADEFILEGELCDAPTAKKRIRALAEQIATVRRELAETRIRLDEARSAQARAVRPSRTDQR